jgi:hypothetical protein
VELGFINALVEMFEEEEILEENTAERIKQDLALAARPLRDRRGFRRVEEMLHMFLVLRIQIWNRFVSMDPGLGKPLVASSLEKENLKILPT